VYVVYRAQDADFCLLSYSTVLCHSYLEISQSTLGVFNTQLSDEGGGIRRSELNKLFNYMYSTAPRPPSPDAADTTPLVSST